MNCRNSSLSVEQALQTGTGVIPVPGAPSPMPIHVNSSCSVTNPLQSFPSRQQLVGPRKRCCTPPQNKEEPSPHQDRVSSGYVPVLSCTVPAEGEEDGLCDIQNTPEKWLFQRASLNCRQGSAGRELELQRSFVPVDHKSSLISMPRCGITSAQHTPREEFSCLNKCIGSFITEHLQHLCGLGDETQTCNKAETAPKYSTAHLTALSLLQGLLS